MLLVDQLTVRYHRYIRQRTEDNLATLLLARDTLKRLSHDEASARKKVRR